MSFWGKSELIFEIATLGPKMGVVNFIRKKIHFTRKAMSFPMGLILSFNTVFKKDLTFLQSYEKKVISGKFIVIFGGFHFMDQNEWVFFL